MATPQPIILIIFLLTPTTNITSQHFLPMQSSMAYYAPPALTCLIEGESSLLRVKPTTDIDMVDLKKLIREEGKNGVLASIDAKELLLWKVRMIMGQRLHN
jgi:Crinkler effector protein N-terminal domain